MGFSLKNFISFHFISKIILPRMEREEEEEGGGEADLEICRGERNRERERGDGALSPNRPVPLSIVHLNFQLS